MMHTRSFTLRSPEREPNDENLISLAYSSNKAIDDAIKVALPIFRSRVSYAVDALDKAEANHILAEKENCKILTSDTKIDREFIIKAKKDLLEAKLNFLTECQGCVASSSKEEARIWMQIEYALIERQLYDVEKENYDTRMVLSKAVAELVTAFEPKSREFDKRNSVLYNKKRSLLSLLTASSVSEEVSTRHEMM